MVIIKVKGMIIKGNYHCPQLGTVIVCRQNRHLIRCPHCKEAKKLWKKDRISRLVPHVQILKERILLNWIGHKWQCRSCFRYFREQFPGLLKYRRYTETYRKEVFNLHKSGISQTDLSRLKRVGSATVERWFHQLLHRKNKEYNSYSYPTHLGIDEHRFTRKVGFCTTLCDLSGHKVLDILKGRSPSQITQQLLRIPGRENVRMVALDLSESYRSVIKHVFPNAVRVADRFHVIRLINQHFLKTIHLIDPSSKYNRGLLSLIRRHYWHCSESQKTTLSSYLDSHPALKPLFFFKQDLVSLLLKKHQTAKQCKQLIPQLIFLISQLKKQHFPALITLANTLDDWIDEIAAMWRFTKSNGITEGFHRKMKLIQRRAYGFKNFENYRLRVRVLCGSMDLNSILV